MDNDGGMPWGIGIGKEAAGAEGDVLFQDEAVIIRRLHQEFHRKVL